MGLRYERHSKRVCATPRWQALRWQILERDGFACVECGKRGRLEVDHIKPVRDNPELSFEPSNLQCLCPACHTRKTRIECGHKPASPDRLKWRVAVSVLEAKRNEHKDMKSA